MCRPPVTKGGTKDDKKPTVPGEKPTGSSRGGIGLEGLVVGLCGAYTFALTLTIPFVADKRDSLGCDALCHGSMTSLRSGLSLVGGVVVGRLSDTYGRIPALVLGIASGIVGTLIFAAIPTLTGLWMSMVPSAAFGHTFVVLKALLSDHFQEAAEAEKQVQQQKTKEDQGSDGSSKASPTAAAKASESKTEPAKDQSGDDTGKRAGTIGKLGTATGLGFMLGPALGGNVLSGYPAAAVLSLVLQAACLALVFLAVRPAVRRSTARNHTTNAPEQKISFFSFLSQGVCRTGAARMLLIIRFSLSLAYHVFHSSFQVSLRTRFDFTPQLHANYMGFAGLMYSLSQAVVAKPLVQLLGGSSWLLICSCLGTLAIGRASAALAVTLPQLFLGTACVILALGVLNTSISATASRIASKEEVGGLFGVIEAVESISGIIGPTMGGLATRAHPFAPLVSVLVAYGLLAALVALRYDATIGARIRAEAHGKAKQD